MTEQITYRGYVLSIDDLERPYFEAAAQGRLVLQACADCGLIRYPPTAYCPRCGSTNAQWRASNGRGRVYGTLVVVHGVRTEFPPPYVIGLVELDDCEVPDDPELRPRLLTSILTLGGTPLDHTLSDGTAVEATFEPIGPGLALPHFRLVGVNLRSEIS